MYDTDYHFSYKEGLKELGCEIIYWDPVGSYQGDYVVLVEKDGMYAYTTIGYGSCSGCDIMLSYDSYNDIDGAKKEIQNTYNKLQWMSLDGIADYLENHDWEGDYIWNSDDFLESLGNLKSVVAKALCE